MRPIIWKFLGCLIFLLCLVWYGKSHFYRDPGSVFYDRENAFEQRYSQVRKAEIDNFVRSQQNTSEDGHMKSGPRPAICAALSSVQRNNTQYLETTLGSLVHGLTPQERQDLHLTVLIAETNASKHTSWDKEWVHSLADDFYTYNVSAKERSYLNHLQQTGEYSTKGVYDYIYALRRCFEAETPYVVMFEDDIILANGWLIRTLAGLRQIASSEERSWLYMRLFNQERSIGWANQYVGGNNEHWIILGIGLVLSGSALFARRCWGVARDWVDMETLWIVVLLLNPALVILFFQSGKASLLPPSPGVFEEPFGCCSQAMVFPREKIPVLISFLETKGKGQVDLLLNDLAEEEQLGRYALYPVQAQHIGVESARKTLKSEAQAVWSMAFEDLDSATLHDEHLKMVHDYYHD